MAPYRAQFKEFEFESVLDSLLEILSSVKVIFLRMIILCISPLVSHIGYKFNNFKDTYSNLIELHALVSLQNYSSKSRSKYIGFNFTFSRFLTLRGAK